MAEGPEGMPLTEANATLDTSGSDTSRLTLLYQVAEQVNSTLELTECLDRIIDGAYRMFQAEKVSLMLLDEGSGELRICAARNVPDEVIARVRVKPGEGLAGKVAASGEPLVVTDVEDDPRVGRKSKEQYRSGSFAVLPLRHKGRVLGVMNLTNRADGTTFSEEDLALLNALANQAAVAIQNARLVAQLNREKEQLKRGAFESNILYQVSSSIRYGLGYQHLIQLLFSSLEQLLDYDVLCSLLIRQGDEDFQTQVRKAVSPREIEAVKRAILEKLAARPHSGVVSQRIEALRAELPDTSGAAANRSLLAVPLEVGGQAVGMICLASCREGVFSGEDAELLHSIVRKMAETVERLRQTIRGEQEKMQSMVASMTEGVLMFDAQDQLVVLNPAARRMLGLSRREEFTTQSLFKSILWKDAGAFLASPVEAGGEVKEFEIDTHPDPRTLHVALTPVSKESGGRLGRLAVMRDVTRERELDRMKSDFVAVVSHELRTPLTSMKSFVSNLLDGVEGELTDGQQQSLLRMMKNLDRLSRLINDLLDLSKLEAGQMQLRRAPLDVAETVESIVAVFEPGAATKDVTLELKLDGGLPVLWADADRLDQVLTNLLGNALKFTPEGGTISARAQYRPPEPAQRIAPAPGRSPISGEGHVVIAVTDTGPGLPPGDLERVFDKFYQADHSMTRKTGGTGLGLPICKEIAEKHGGTIRAESPPGKGATFVLELPVDGRTHDRSQLVGALEREIRRARRYRTPFSVLMLDLDDFTAVNDEFGSPRGDTALVLFRDMVTEEVKNFLSERIRETDDVGRFGGDEFLILAPETDAAGASQFAERIRRLVEQNEFTVDDVCIQTTVSVGVAPFVEEDVAPIRLIRRAAAALADAKADGKNQVRGPQGPKKEEPDDGIHRVIDLR
ncbi:MAG: GAF domain-containing protein [Planctomycetota bacterium]